MPVISTEAKRSGEICSLCTRARRCALLVGRLLIMSAIALLLGTSVGLAQSEEPDPVLPLITGGEMPSYPLVALHARVQGVVKLRIATSKSKVLNVTVLSGPAMLAGVAKNNVLTWHLQGQKSAEFIATYEYVITEPSYCYFTNSAVTTHLPLAVSIHANGLRTCDPGSVSQTKH